MRLEQLQIVLRDEMGKEMRAVADKMAAGRAVDYAGYRQLVGHIQGLAAAIDRIDAVFKQFYNDEGE